MDKQLWLYLLQDECAKEEIQIIPMIDVMLFLLVFFMVYTLNVVPLMVQDIKVPTSSTLERKELKDPLRIYISKEGQISFAGQSSDLPDLRAYLKQFPKKEELSILIIADKEVKIQKVVEVIDIAKEEGIHRIALSGEKK